MALQMDYFGRFHRRGICLIACNALVDLVGELALNCRIVDVHAK